MSSWRHLLQETGARVLRRLLRMLLRESTSHARGMGLLRDWLSPAQREQLDAEGQFEVIGSDSGKRYRIRYGYASNVFEIDQNGRTVAGWCFVPMGTRVVGDVMLTQKLALEICEADALAAANRMPQP